MLRTVCNLAISCSRVAPIRARWLHAGSTHWQQGVPATLDCGHVVVVSEDRRKITLVCEGEQKRRFHGKWLRHNCRCPVCTSVHTGQTIVDPKDLANDLKIEFADISGDQVNVRWSVSGNTVHTGSFPVEWLRENDYSNPETNRNNKPLVADSLPVSRYEDVMSSDEGLYHWLLQLNQYGVSLLKNIPTRETELLKVIHRVGPVYSTVYGETFDVVASETPINQAYSADALLMHMDQGFYESTPGLQLLHCIRFDECVEGGESVLLDTYPVVEEMRRRHPKQFDTLTRVPVPFVRIHYTNLRSVDYFYEKKTVELNDDQEIVGINWHPQLHGPLRIKDDDLVEEYYDAFTLLNKMLEDSQLKLVHRLLPGEAVVFHNRRFLHSRAAFRQHKGLRFLKGGYISLDDFRSRLVTLRKILGKTDILRLPLNGSGRR